MANQLDIVFESNKHKTSLKQQNPKRELISYTDMPKVMGQQYVKVIVGIAALITLGQMVRLFNP